MIEHVWNTIEYVWGWASANSSGIQAVSTVVQVFFASSLIAVTGAYVILTRSIAKATCDEHTHINRAYIGIVKCAYDSEKQNLLKACIKNYGRAPAIIKKRLITIDNDEPKPANAEDSEVEGDIVLFPNEEKWMQIDAFNDDMTHIIHFRFEYETQHKDRYIEYLMKHDASKKKTVGLSAELG